MPVDDIYPSPRTPRWWDPGAIEPQTPEDSRALGEQIERDAPSALGRLLRLPLAMGLAGGIPGAMTGMIGELIAGASPRGDRAVDEAMAFMPAALHVPSFKSPTEAAEWLFVKGGEGIKSKLGGMSAETAEVIDNSIMNAGMRLLDPAEAAKITNLDDYIKSVVYNTERSAVGGLSKERGMIESLDAPNISAEGEVLERATPEALIDRTTLEAAQALDAPAKPTVFVPEQSQTAWGGLRTTKPFSTARRMVIWDAYQELANQLAQPDTPSGRYLRHKAELAIVKRAGLRDIRQLHAELEGIKQDYARMEADVPGQRTQVQSLWQKIGAAKLAPIERTIVKSRDLRSLPWNSIATIVETEHGAKISARRVGQIYQSAIDKINKIP